MGLSLVEFKKVYIIIYIYRDEKELYKHMKIVINKSFSLNNKF